MHTTSRTRLSTAACGLVAVPALALAAPAGTRTVPVAHTAAGVAMRPACPRPTRPGVMSCQVLTPTHVTATGTIRPSALPSGILPADLRAAYRLPPPPAGAGRTVAVVDAMDDPNAEADLATYRSTFGLPPCTTANGCFRKVNQNGTTSPLPAPDIGWAAEISLDLDMVSAVCPACHILLVEASSASFTNLGTAVNTAVRLGARFVTNAYGAPESSGDATIAVKFYDHPGVVLTAPGDGGGFGVTFPASAPGVVAVGGTSLVRDRSVRGFHEVAVPGGGCSTLSPKPPWQHDTLCPRRTLVDVAAVADPDTGVAVYDTFGGTGYSVFGGSSVPTSIIAAVYALAGTPPARSRPASFPYADPGDLFDVTTGPGAGPGYDEPTGMGTPNGVAAFGSSGST